MSNNLQTGVRSTLLPIQRGVPQGLVLGPVLFILFVNNLPRFLYPHCLAVLYADDAVLLTSSPSVENLEDQHMRYSVLQKSTVGTMTWS
ncbi:reverse transcriptase domain-containing protein [Klebsiella pneumoniae]|uniref:reverse transcriptase domain-containing protein n=1 Tax=Klebsiella pneumoniae TaxID=573 RepID=UPI00163DB48E